MSPPPLLIGAARYRWRSAPEPTDVRGSRHLVFGPEAPGAIPCRRRSGSHRPPDLWIDVRRVLVPFTARLFVMSAEYGRGSREASSRRSTPLARPRVAERVGFEPTKSFDSALFKSAAINRSATSPGQGYREVAAWPHRKGRPERTVTVRPEVPRPGGLPGYGASTTTVPPRRSCQPRFRLSMKIQMTPM